MKRAIILVLALFVISDVAAQTEGFTFGSVRIGQTKAQGEYAENVFDQTTENAGFAESGFHLNIEGGRFFNNNMGLVASLSLSFNGLDDGALVAEALEALPALTSLAVDASNYTNVAVLIGPIARLPISSRISLLGFAKIGVMTSTRPSSEISWQRNDGIPLSAEFEGTWGTAFAFSVGAALKTRIFGSIEIGPQVEYVSGKPTYGFYDYDPFFGWTYTEGKAQVVDLLNFGFGITYNMR